MKDGNELSPGDDWPHHYRGFSLQTNPNGDVWWQLYQGTDRLVLEPTPEEIVDRLLDFKRIGGRMHITEQGDVLTKVEADDEYDQIYVGSIDDLDGKFTPEDAPEYSIDLQPSGLKPGDLWPSVYDGSRYSFIGDRFWWHSSQSHKRHPVPDGLPKEIESNLRRYKPDGGSFRVLPWGDVVTLVSLHPTPEKVSEQFNELPRVVRNIIKLRKDRDVEMLPIYIGSLDEYEIEIEEPTSLTDSLTDKEQESLSSWAQNLGRTSSRSTAAHEADDAGSPTSRQSKQSEDKTAGGDPSSGETSFAMRGQSEKDGTKAKNENEDDSANGDKVEPEIDDDPLEWIREDLEGMGEPDADGGQS